MLERPLTKEFPDTEEKVVNRMLMDGRIELMEKYLPFPMGP